MPHTDFSGDITTRDHEIIEEILSAWLSVPGLRMKSQRSRFEVSYEDATVELYCHEARPATGTGYGFFLLDGGLALPRAEAADRLAALGRLCGDRGLRFEISHVEVDAEGNELGDEWTIR
ncbi:hypothetical protein [Amycolatopsis sp. NPDC058986]|uniref:hypothetical protein n=1 Tax=unclassified Amycolatopsis TaxID=2618356 RepID=UPI003671271D